MFVFNRSGSAYSAGRLFVRISLPALLLTAAVLGGYHYIQFSMDLRLLKAKEMSRIDVGVESIRRQFRSLTSDLRYLANSGYLHDYLAINGEYEEEDLAQEFLALVRSKEIYDQIRYIDKSGMEKVRVNRNVDSPYIVHRDDLQDKGDRYYFLDTMNISCREVFVSPLDLNIENGEIERPLKPMIRFGTPVCDSLWRKQGAIVFNFLGANMLNNLKNMLGEMKSGTMLVNSNGYWLLSPDPGDEWGFMFKKETLFKNRYPDAWQAIRTEKSGQMGTAHGVFTFKTIYPLEEGQASTRDVHHTSAGRENFIESRDYFWVLILHIPKAKIQEEINGHLTAGSTVLALIIAIMLPLTWLYSREKVRASAADDAVEMSEEFTRAVTSQLGEGLIVLDDEKKILMMNPKCQELLGWRESDLLHGNIEAIIPEFEDSCYSKDSKEDHARAGHLTESIKIEPFYLGRKAGEKLPVTLTISSLYIQGREAGSILTFNDITERLHYEEKLKKVAAHDPLTGVKNRGEFDRLFLLEIERCKRYGRQCALLLLDIDHFKQINDTYGHPFGDRILKGMCDHINCNLRDNDFIGRYGGEEFAIILPESDQDRAKTFASRLRESIKKVEFRVEEQQRTITVSIGVAIYPIHGEDCDNLLQKADEALYEAKSIGRDRVVISSQA